jgi:hypothetical protein
MIKVKEECKGYNVPYKGHKLGTLQGDNLKSFIKAFLFSKNPNKLLAYFDNTLEELSNFAESAPKKVIKKPIVTEPTSEITE